MTSAWGALVLGLPVEYDVVGHNTGLRPELVVPFTDRSAVRLAVGALASRENLFTPVSAGWRLRTGPEHAGHAVFGAGLEAQTFWFTDRPPHARAAFYGEIGAGVSLGDHLDVGALVVPELAPFGVPGIGLGTRLGVWWAR